jgi:hypothetical protein
VCVFCWNLVTIDMMGLLLSHVSDVAAIVHPQKM